MRTVIAIGLLALSLTACNAASLVQRHTAASCTPTLLPNPSPKLQCGKTYAIRHPSLLQNVSVAGAEDPTTSCYGLCYNTTGCISFGIDGSANQCMLYSKSIHNMGHTKKSSPYVLYNLRCFECIAATTCIVASLAQPTALTPYDFTSNTATSNSTNQYEDYTVTLPFSLFNGETTEDEFTLQVNLGGYAQSTNGTFYEYAPFFKAYHDLQYIEGQDQGVFYEVSGQAPNRIAVFEWRVTNYNQNGNISANSEVYHFFMELFESNSDAAFSYIALSEPEDAYVFTYTPEDGEINYISPNDGAGLIYDGLILYTTIHGDFTPNLYPACSAP